MTTQLSIQEIRSLPKIDLHRHLDCSMRWSTLLEIATELKIPFPQNLAQQREHFLVTSPMKNLEQVLSKFQIAQKVLHSEEVLERLAFEACEDAFNDGIRILELRYAPTFIQQGHFHLSFEKIHQSFLKGIERAQKQMNLVAGLICIIQRTSPIKMAESVTDFAIENKNTFLAVDLADNEDGFEPELFSSLFNRAKKSGMNITVHSGEVPSPKSEKWILDAIDILGAHRIGHGVQSIHSKKIIQKLKAQNIVLEVCPYSNYLTQAFESYNQNPLKQLKNEGVLVTINSDDPGIFGSLLSDDYLIAQKYLNFSAQDFHDCNEIAFKHSFISEVEKNKVWFSSKNKNN